MKKKQNNFLKRNSVKIVGGGVYLTNTSFNF